MHTGRTKHAYTNSNLDHGVRNQLHYQPEGRNEYQLTFTSATSGEKYTISTVCSMFCSFPLHLLDKSNLHEMHMLGIYLSSLFLAIKNIFYLIFEGNSTENEPSLDPAMGVSRYFKSNESTEVKIPRAGDGCMVRPVRQKLDSRG